MTQNVTTVLGAETPVVLARPRPLERLAALVSLLRPKQWVKGGLVLLAPVAGAPRPAVTHAVPLALALAAFLLAASAVYVFNDLRDRERDRRHPVKKMRPIASGRVSVRAAVAVLVLLACASVALLITLPPLTGLIIGVYLAMNFWYTVSLKHQPLVDVSIVSTGFVLRVLAGAVAVGMDVQPTLLITVYCACMAISLGKRRHELAALSMDGGAAHRPSLKAYSVPFLDQVVGVNLVAALVGYVAYMWLQAPPYGPVPAALTFPFAAFTVYRYLQMVTVDNGGGNPSEDLVRDRALLANLAMWALVLLPEIVMALR